MKPLVVAAGGFLILLLMASATGAQQQDNDLTVLAFYYSWYGDSDWADSRRMPDFPVQTYPYGDPSAIERHVIEGKAASLDGFVMSWFGSEQGNPTDEHFRYLLRAAERHDFTVAIDFDMGSGFSTSREALVENLRFMYANYLNHPNYLRYDGRPVVFFWKQERLFSTQTWAEIRADIDPDHHALWIAEGVNSNWVNDTFDGLHLYNIAWSPSPAATLHRFERETRARGGIWVATAMPGWNDTGLVDERGSGAFAVNRRDGGYFRETFAAALDTNPDMLVITSYNEWLEGSYLANSQLLGNRYVGLTRQLIDDLRNSPPAPRLLPGVTDVVAQPSTNLNLRSGPGQGYREIGDVASDAVLPVVGRFNDWLLVDSPNGRGWITYELTLTLGDMNTVPETWWYVEASEQHWVSDGLARAVGWLAAPLSEDVLLWSSPSEGGEFYAPVRRLGADETLPIIGVYRGYYQTAAGWLRVSDVNLVDVNGASAPATLSAIYQTIPTENGIYAQAIANVILRAEPNGQRLAEFPFTAVAPAFGLSADGQWVRIRYNGQDGWVGRQFITPHGDFTELE
jgi:uncharacterized protein YraI